MAKPPHWHVLSNIDLDKRTGDCSLCGVGVKIRVRIRDGKVRSGCDSPMRDGRGHVARKRERNPSYVPNLATPLEMEQALLEQDGKCMICNGSDQMVPDHDHSTGVFRAWLCWGCNVGLGHFRENPEALRAAASYIEHAKAPRP